VKHFTHLALPFLIAAACTGGDQGSPTSPGTSLSASAQVNAPAATSQASATSVRIVDLGTLPGGWPSFAKAINGGRVIVGYSYTGANFSGVPHAVRWQEPTPGGGSWAIQDLSPLITGGVKSEATAINANGDIAGWMKNAAGEDVSFLLSAGGTLAVIAPPVGKNGTFPYGVSVGGAVVGAARLNPDNTGATVRAFYYENGTTVLLPTLSGMSQANAIKDDGTVVGYSVDAANIGHAVKWTNDGLNWQITTLPGNASSSALAISSTGRIAGSGCPTATPTSCVSAGRAYFWASDATAPTVLGTLGGKSSTGYGVNDAGDVTGESYTKTGLQRAFFSAAGSGSLIDLGSLGGGTGFSTAAGISGHLVVGLTVAGSGRLPPWHAALWIVP
jgi:probable HAF family extracellular repeat protein